MPTLMTCMLPSTTYNKLEALRHSQSHFNQKKMRALKNFNRCYMRLCFIGFVVKNNLRQAPFGIEEMPKYKHGSQGNGMQHK